uniref:Uncharacterized protein n=1 Tax=Anguilla anguilla TaxID=7936 RepID=A0A0E9UVF6_ANGAN
MQKPCMYIFLFLVGYVFGDISILCRTSDIHQIRF